MKESDHLTFLEPKEFYDLQRAMQQRYVDLLGSAEFVHLPPYTYLKRSSKLVEEIQRIEKWCKKSPFNINGLTIGEMKMEARKHL